MTEQDKQDLKKDLFGKKESDKKQMLRLKKKAAATIRKAKTTGKIRKAKTTGKYKIVKKNKLPKKGFNKANFVDDEAVETGGNDETDIDTSGTLNTSMEDFIDDGVVCFVSCFFEIEMDTGHNRAGFCSVGRLQTD